MYYYIVDPQNLTQREFERVQSQLYSSLSEFRISGEVMRITGLRTINQLVETAFAHNAKTIVAVGSDDTLHDVINAVKLRDVAVGFIPLFESELGEILGIKNIDYAAKIIAGRRIALLDLGVVNNLPRVDSQGIQTRVEAGNYFLSNLKFSISYYVK